MCTKITKKQTAENMDPKRVVTAYKVITIAAKRRYSLFQDNVYKSGWMKAEEDWSRPADDWTRSGLAVVGLHISGSAFHCMPTMRSAKNFLSAYKRRHILTSDNARLAEVKLRGCVAYGKGANVGDELDGYPSIVGREMRIVRVHKDN